jgi:hypothetical protein
MSEGIETVQPLSPLRTSMRRSLECHFTLKAEAGAERSEFRDRSKERRPERDPESFEFPEEFPEEFADESDCPEFESMGVRLPKERSESPAPNPHAAN